MTDRRVSVAIFALASALLAVAAPSCNPSGQACAPGDIRYCDCPSIARGYQQCVDDGSLYGACDCSGNIPPGAGILVEAGTDADSAPPSDGGRAGFLESCVNDTDCTTGLCYAFIAYGPHCSGPCAKDVDCPPPSPGCNMKGVCKLH